MAMDPALRALDVTLPASPQALITLSALLEKDDVTTGEVAAVVETDLALAAAVVRTVNSAMFGILRRVETVSEAVQFLGMREVAALTYEHGLRSRFAPSRVLDEVWQRARLRGLLMGRVAAGNGIHGWRAHSAGLFAETGKAVLCAHDSARYATMLDGLNKDAAAVELIAIERDTFGVDHAVLGSALCRAWGLAADVADYVHDRVRSSDDWQQRQPSVRAMLCLGALADQRLPPAQGHPEPLPAPALEVMLTQLKLPLAAVQVDLQRQWDRLCAE